MEQKPMELIDGFNKKRLTILLVILGASLLLLLALQTTGLIYYLITAPQTPQEVSNQARVTFEDASGNSYGPVYSNTVTTTIQPSTTTPSATLSLVPNSGSFNVGDTLTLEVRLDTGGSNVVAASVFLAFNPSYLQYQSIDSSNSDFNTKIKEGPRDNNTIEISRINFVSGGMDVNPISGSNLLVAKVNFKAIAAGTASVVFTTSEPSRSAVIKFDPNNPQLAL
jgi:hypothetical protein